MTPCEVRWQGHNVGESRIAWSLMNLDCDQASTLAGSTNSPTNSKMKHFSQCIGAANDNCRCQPPALCRHLRVPAASDCTHLVGGLAQLAYGGGPHKPGNIRIPPDRNEPSCP